MKHIFLLTLVAFPAVILSFDKGSQIFARAEEAEVEDDFEVEGEGEDTAVSDEGGDEEDLIQTGASPDADTTILFTSPATTAGGSTELPAGKVVEFLVGFHNKGKQDFVLETLEASFRYPMDFSYYIQNFSAIAYNKLVKPSHEATLGYSFMVSESIAGRLLGLNIHINYRDFEGNLFGESVFNETVNIVELEEGLDGETILVYVFLAASVVLLLVLGQQFLVSVGKKRGSSTPHPKKPVIETGTTTTDDGIDFTWLPKGMMNSKYKDKTSPKSSPRSNKQPQSPKANKQQGKQQQQQQQPKQQQQKNQQQQQQSKQNMNHQQSKHQQQQKQQNHQQSKQQSPKDKKGKKGGGD